MNELPEKWCVKAETKEEADIIQSFKGISENHDASSTCFYQHYPPFQLNCVASYEIYPSYTEITFEQFKMYVLNSKPKPVIVEDYRYLTSILKKLKIK